ncbi:hypothetical protein CTEN210_05997 [Chaetoceros tenuissimus]|uniref:SAM domain-containing protein n=1 Tax=Chaetoceros tenuissimus TaxID=426638 RepID=A0AAD3CQX4_9STRA|nr:hypothetical protein CTEN210_05997 [Chaetoceros tenuissimus]
MKAYSKHFRTVSGQDLINFNEHDLQKICKSKSVTKVLYKRLKHIQRSASREKEPECDSSEEEPIQNNASVEKVQQIVEAIEMTECLNESKELEQTPSSVLEVNEKEPSEEEIELNKKNEAAIILQSFHRQVKATYFAFQCVQEQYMKVYDLESGRFVYVYRGRFDLYQNKYVVSTLVRTKTLRRKPYPLRHHDLNVTFTTDLAVMRIQLFARYCFTIKRTRTIARRIWRRQLDPVSGRHFYFLPRLNIKQWHKPLIFGKERWNQNDLIEWDYSDVKLFFRRIGLKHHEVFVHIYELGLDGELLSSLSEIDIIRLNLPDTCRRRIMSLIQSSTRPKDYSIETKRRRNILRQHFKYIDSAVTIQKNVRRFLSVKVQQKWKSIIDHYKGIHALSSKCPWWSQQSKQFMIICDSHKRRKAVVVE